MPLITYNVKEGVHFNNIERFHTISKNIEFIMAFTSECQHIADKYLTSLTVNTNKRFQRFDDFDKAFIVIYSAKE